MSRRHQDVPGATRLDPLLYRSLELLDGQMGQHVSYKHDRKVQKEIVRQQHLNFETLSESRVARHLSTYGFAYR